MAILAGSLWCAFPSEVAGDLADKWQSRIRAGGSVSKGTAFPVSPDSLLLQQLRCPPFFQHSHFRGWPACGPAGYRGSAQPPILLGTYPSHPEGKLQVSPLGSRWQRGAGPQPPSGEGSEWTASQRLPPSPQRPRLCFCGRNHSQIQDSNWGFKTLNPLGLLSCI